MVKRRKAIAMIELIIAIVIMGIALLAIPMINKEAVRSGESAMLQESVAAGASQIQLILSKHWDEGNANPALGASILTTTSGNFNTYGGLNPASRTTLNTNGAAVAASNALGAEGGDRDDIDDFDGIAVGLIDIQGTTALHGDYADENIIMNTVVNYGNDGFNTAQTINGVNPFGGGGATTNIKLITMTLSHGGAATNIDSIDNKSVVLYAFSCNIGSTKPNIKGD
jgi:Tfp pilus assembly major pilin PilA